MVELQLLLTAALDASTVIPSPDAILHGPWDMFSSRLNPDAVIVSSTECWILGKLEVLLPDPSLVMVEYKL